MLRRRGEGNDASVLLYLEEQRALGVDSKEIQKPKAPSKTGIVWMLSPYNHLADSDTGQVEHFPGHLMFHAP